MTRSYREWQRIKRMRHRGYRPDRHHSWSGHHYNSSNNFNLHHFGSSKTGRFFIALLIAVAAYLLAVNITNSLFLWLEAAAWIYFAFILYKDVFIWANRVSMADDLAFWGLRILGGFVFIFGIYMAFFTAVASIFSRGVAAMSIPIYCLLGGLILLSAFIAFRTNRRYPTVGFWNA